MNCHRCNKSTVGQETTDGLNTATGHWEIIHMDCRTPGEVAEMDRMDVEVEEFMAIMKHPIVGNAHDDRALMNRIHNFVADEKNGMYNRRSVLHRLDAVMGEKTVFPTEEDVNFYLSDL